MDEPRRGVRVGGRLIRGSYALHTALLRSGRILAGMSTDDAIRIRQERRARVRRIRGHVVGYSIALFMVVWAVLAVVLVTGHDPVLSRTGSSTAVAASSPSTSGSGSSATSASGSDDGSSGVSSSTGTGGVSSSTGFGSTGSSNATGSGSVSPVTSSQS